MKFAFLLLSIYLANVYAIKEDYYKLLNVSRDANLKDIRKAFKVLAVQLHPDKNKGDKTSHEKFVKLTQAYDILADTEKRKKYDLYGDTELDGDNVGKTRNYHSYTYYRDQFGIYDDDPLIVTLGKTDFETNVLDKNQVWFVNFYSPLCHYCQELSSVWRKLALELEGVIRIGAVNCEDDWALCSQLNINAYPTLLYYERNAHLYEGELYRGLMSLTLLTGFVLSRFASKIETITADKWHHENRKQWLLFFCIDDILLCPEKDTQIKIAATFDGLLSVGVVTDEKLYKSISKFKSAVIFWQVDDENKSRVYEIFGSDTKEIADNILNFLIVPEQLTDVSFREIRTQLGSGDNKPWLICFFMGPVGDLNLQLKRLSVMIPNIHIGLLHCGRFSALCGSLYISHYPSWGVLKKGGGFELHSGRDILHEIAAFARDSANATNFHALSPADFSRIKFGDMPWFVDWYAPWCPPCQKLMPVIRRASTHFTAESVQFGTIDCTRHGKLCISEGIQSYPTTMLYNNSRVYHFHGTPNEESLVEFIQDSINPTVLTLDDSSFIQLMRKPIDKMWIVDFYAPWCGPCQMLAPQWRILAKQLIGLDQIKVAQVDCVANDDLCKAQNIRSYPTIRLYTLGEKGLDNYVVYNGHRDVSSLKRWLMGFLPSSIKHFTAEEFKDEILHGQFRLPWLVDFYASWCGHCVNFEPDFVNVAQRLQGKINSGKIDCDKERAICTQMRITSYPTVFLFISSKEKYEINSQIPSEIVQKVESLITHNSIKEEHDEL